MAPRIPYVALDIDSKVATQIRARRNNSELLELDRTLLHSEPIALAWNTMLGAVRTGTSLPPRLRELIICRVAVVNKAQYEWDQHVGLLSDSGVSPMQLDALADLSVSYAALANVFDTDAGISNHAGGDVGIPTNTHIDGPTHALAIEATDALTRDVAIPDALFVRLKARFSETEVVEIVITISSYNMVSRFLVALHVGQ
ncbi:putative 4-carboxymuconolactone decarboxylase [Chytriomyces cf. hyalinus JEL632]|nr:putative 4-carboxymuconolactone decarboxylase [Chytriomyces cf. hyalinus JEL632]